MDYRNTYFNRNEIYESNNGWYTYVKRMIGKEMFEQKTMSELADEDDNY